MKRKKLPDQNRTFSFRKEDMQVNNTLSGLINEYVFSILTGNS